MNTFGLIAVGGKGLRLGLPFSKEMLPQKGYDYYNPLINHTVEKMLLGGAEKIVFVHGEEYKEDIKNHFNSRNYIHIKQKEAGFANVIKDFYLQIQPNDEDSIFFGLPDTIYDDNPFIFLNFHKGIVCGLFKTDNHVKVDRLLLDNKTFEIKTEKKETNLDFFWGVLKFEGSNIKKMIELGDFDKFTEIGQILNKYDKTFLTFESYLDLGIWANYNIYCSSSDFANREIEKKYKADSIDENNFIDYFKSKANLKYLSFDSTDYYFSNPNNKNIEFIRYRAGNENAPDSTPDLTIKNFNSSSFNRFELTIPIEKDHKFRNVFYFLSLLGLKFEFEITKTCHIFSCKDYTIVLYSFEVNGIKTKIIEIELHKLDFVLIKNFELEVLKEFGINLQQINKSKFQIIKELKNI